MIDFLTSFSAAFKDGRRPYDHQKRLACGERQKDQSVEGWLTSPAPCQSQLTSIPIGLGKTAA